MKSEKGKQIIGKYEGVGLLIDFDDLLKYGGERHIKDRIDSSLGVIFFLIGALLLILPGVLQIALGEYEIGRFLSPESVLDVVPWFSIYSFLYGLYLRRDKDEFSFNTEEQNLRETIKSIKRREVRELEIDNYYSESLLRVIDFAYFKDKNKFLRILADLVLRDKEVEEITKSRLNVDPEKVYEETDLYLARFDTSFKKNGKPVLLDLFTAGYTMNLESIDVMTAFFVLSKHYINEVLYKFDVQDLEIEGLKQWYRNKVHKKYYDKVWKYRASLKPVGAINRAYTSRATPALDSFGRDLTAFVARHGLRVSIGKDELMQSTLRSLRQESNSSVLILGDPGVGKSYFLESLATRMVVEDVPEEIRDMRLVVIDLSIVMARFGSIDGFQQNLEKMFKETVDSGNIILVFEEFGQFFTLREDIRFEVINLLSEYIDRYKIKVIATSDQFTYKLRMSSFKGIVSMFDIQKIPDMPDHLSFQILMDQVAEIEKNHNIAIKTSAVKQIVKYAPFISHERVMPDKGLDFLEEAAIRAKAMYLDYLDGALVDTILSEQLGIKIGTISEGESGELQNLEELLHKRVVGQSRAIKAVASALRRARAGLNSGKRPVASFLFYGPTGVGKTEVSKALSEVYYGSEDLMIRLDMSEFQEEENLGRMIGEVNNRGEFVGGYLTEAIRSRPYSLVLLDEIEKANPKILDIFLQILDEGNVTDGAGREVDFTNAIIIATSNAGSKRIAELSGSKTYEQIKSEVEPILRDVFRVEFLNRFDKLIQFSHLSKIDIEAIANIMLKKLSERIKEQKNIFLEWDKKTIELLRDEAYDPVYGARELRRVIQETIEDRIASAIVAKKVGPGDTVVFKGLKITRII